MKKAPKFDPRRQARRQRALDRLKARPPTPERQAEIATLEARLARQPG